jgi:hypothetical protein
MKKIKAGSNYSTRESALSSAITMYSELGADWDLTRTEQPSTHTGSFMIAGLLTGDAYRTRLSRVNTRNSVQALRRKRNGPSILAWLRYVNDR